MACSLTITSVTGLAPVAGVPTAIRVTGTAAECREVSLLMRCQGAGSDGAFTGTAPVSAVGTWTADVSIPSHVRNCQCRGGISVQAMCTSDRTCTTSFVGPFSCEDEVEECPIAAFGPLTIGDCNPDGTRTVAISATVTGTGIFTAELRDSTAVLDTVTGPGALTLSGSGNYGATISFSVVITAPVDCAGITLPAIGLPPCVACPDVGFDYDIGACDAVGNRSVTVTAEVIATGTVTAELQHPLGVVLDTASGSGTLTLSHTGSYPGGTSQTFHVVITSPTTCGESEVTVDIPACVCPDISFITSTGDCRGDSRPVTITAELSAAGLYTAELQGPGGLLDTVSGTGTQTLTATANFPGGTSQTFTVVVTSPAGCDGQSITVDVPACGGDDDDDGDGSFGCLFGRIIIAAAGAIALLALILALCVPAAATALLIVAAAFAALAIVVMIFWLIFCDAPCRWAVLLGGQVLLGAGIGALIFSACCPWVFWVGLIMALIGLGLLFLWRALCDISFCDLAKEITYVIGGIVLPIVGIIVLIPVLVACVNTVALGVVGAVFGPIAVYAAAC